MNQLFVIRLVLRLIRFLGSIENLVGGMLILFPGFLPVCLHSVLALLLQVLLVVASERLVFGSRLGKIVAD